MSTGGTVRSEMKSPTRSFFGMESSRPNQMVSKLRARKSKGIKRFTSGNMPCHLQVQGFRATETVQGAGSVSGVMACSTVYKKFDSTCINVQ